MVPALRDVLLGEPAERHIELLAAVAVFVGTFVAYAGDVFTVDGGVILLPQDATYVGTLVAAGIGYRRGSLLGAWVSLFAAYLGVERARGTDV
jgi:hypothetical protein